MNRVRCCTGSTREASIEVVFAWPLVNFFCSSDQGGFLSSIGKLTYLNQHMCRQQAGLSGYQSGEEYENASGPLDTQERSFTGNPPVSSTGNTSPTQVHPLQQN